MTYPNNYGRDDVARAALKELRQEAGYYPPNPWLNSAATGKEKSGMSKLRDRLIAALVSALLPRLLEQIVMALEELVKLDLNKDGHIGFEEQGNG